MSTNPFDGKETTDLTVTQSNASDEFIGELISESRVTQFCSLTPTTQKEKLRLYNIMNTPDARLAECINMEISITDVFVEIVQVRSENTGEINTCPRIILIDSKGKSYVAVSIGVFNSLKKLMHSFGLPTWAEPVIIVPKQIKKGTNSILTLTVKE